MSINNPNDANFGFIPEENSLELNFLEPDGLGSDTLSNNLESGLLTSSFISPESLVTKNIPIIAPGIDSLSGSDMETKELIFVDDTVVDYQSIVRDIDAEVIKLDSSSNGIEQIAEVLAGYEDLDAVHLISHGDGGLLQLGDTTLDWEGFDEYSDELIAWGNALADEADFLIYGCNVAEGVEGEAFVDRLSSLTGADVAASDDLTGNDALGGDWDLEYSIGNIQAASIVSSDFSGVLSNTLTIVGTPDRDTLNLSVNNNTLTVNISTVPNNNSFNPPPIETTLNLSLEGVTNIAVDAGSGDDTIAFSSSLAGYSLSIDGQLGEDTVTFSQDVFTDGKNLAVTTETINVNSGVTLSTRDVTASGQPLNTDATSHLNSASQGNSGVIAFTGKNITVNDNARLLSHVVSGYTAGNISLNTSETKDLGVINSNSSVNLTGAIIKGGDITIQSTAKSTNLYNATEQTDNAAINALNKGLADVLSFVGTIPAPLVGAVKADATANINIQGNTNIEGNKVSVTANADAIGKITPLSLGLPLAFGYGETNPTANVTVGNGVTIKSTDDLILSSNSESDVDITSIAAMIGSLPSLTKALMVGTVLNSNIKAKTDVQAGATLTVGRDLEVSTVTTKDHQIGSSAFAFDDGLLAVSVAIANDRVNTDTFVDGQVTAGGSTLIKAEGKTPFNDAAASATTGSSLLARALNFVLPSIPFRLPSLSSLSFLDNKAFSGGLSYLDTDNKVNARVGNSARVKSGGSLDIFAKSEELPELSAISAADSADPNTQANNRVKENSFSFAVSYGNVVNNADAFIGDNAIVDSGRNLTVQSETSIPFNNTFVGGSINSRDSVLKSYEFNPATRVNTTADTISFATPHDFTGGENVTYIAKGDDIGGLVDGQTYQVDRVDADTMKLKQNNSVINLTSTGTGFAHKLRRNDLKPGQITAQVFDHLLSPSNLGVQNGLFTTWSQSYAGATENAGAGGFNVLLIENNSKAYIASNAQVNQDQSVGYRTGLQKVAVKALNDTFTLNLSGQTDLSTLINLIPSLAGASPSKGVGASVGVLTNKNNVEAKIHDNALVSGNNLDVIAKSTNKTYGMAEAGATSSKSEDFAVNVSAFGITFNNNTIAHIDDGAIVNINNPLSINGSGNINVDAVDSTTAYNFGGAVGKSENVAVGASVSVSEINRNTQAIIGTKEKTLSFNAKDSVNTSDDSFSLKDHGLSTGDIVVYSAGLGLALADLTSGESYYVIKVDKDKFKLATTYANATATTPTAKNLTATGDSSSQKFVIAPSKTFDPNATDKIEFNPGGGAAETIDYINPETFNILEGTLDSSGNAIDDTQNTITFTKDHGLAKGDLVQYRNQKAATTSNTDIGGLTANSIYYAIVVDSKTIKLAKTANDADSGTAISFTNKGQGVNHGFYRQVLSVNQDKIYYPNHGFSSGDKVFYNNGAGTDWAGLTRAY